MELDARLRAYVAFVRRKSFSAAAGDLRISQPAVSKHIADLERELGVKLIERRARSLTEAGEYLAGHVVRAEALLKQAARGLTSLRDPIAGTVSIIASGTPGTYVLPRIIAAFQNAHPGVRFQFELATSLGVVDVVRAHRAELGVTGGFIGAPELEAEPLFEDEIVVVGSAKISRRRLTRDNLEDLTWISREEGSATRAIADSALADLGILPRRRLALPAWESIKIAVRENYGIAAFSRHAVEEELASGALVEIPFGSWRVRRMFSLIRIRDAALTPAAQQFTDILLVQCRALRAAPRLRKRRGPLPGVPYRKSR
jgi:LysR family transcriptional regulator, transcriptional activator of the cysJI operon